MALRDIVIRMLGVENDLRRLREQVLALGGETGDDERFANLNPAGLRRFVRRCQPRGIRRYIVLLDLDNLPELEIRYGKEEVQRRVERMFRIPARGSDYFIGKVFGESAVLCVTGIHFEDAQALAQRLQDSARTHGLSFAHAIGIWNTDEELSKAAAPLSEKLHLCR